MSQTMEVVYLPTPEPKRSSFLAAVLSIIVPGLGHLYKGRIVSAVLWFVVTGFAYGLLLVPGIFLHALCVFFAAMARAR